MFAQGFDSLDSATRRGEIEHELTAGQLDGFLDVFCRANHVRHLIVPRPEVAIEKSGNQKNGSRTFHRGECLAKENSLVGKAIVHREQA